MTNITRVVRSEYGATAIEYAVIASLLSVVILGAVTLVGTSLNAIFSSVASGF